MPSAEANDQLRRRFVEVARRAEIVSLINAASSEEDLGRSFAEELCEVFDAEVAFVVKDGGERAEPRTVAAIGIDADRVLEMVGRLDGRNGVDSDRASVLEGENVLGIGARSLMLAPFTDGERRRALVGVARLYEAGLDETDRSLLEAVTLAVGHALERIWANDSRDRVVAQQSSLVRAAKSLGRSLDIEEVLQKLCEEVKLALDCHNVVAAVGNDADGYVTVGVAGIDRSFLGFRQPPGTGLGGRALEAGRILVTHRYREDGFAPPETSAFEEVRTSIAAPLRWDDAFRAFVSAGFAAPHPIAASDVELMEGFAELAGLACANAERHARVQTAAEIDGLTGCLNRDALEVRLAEAIDDAAASSEPLSLALIDLDRFKQINDVFGHPSGDAVLRSVGQALRSSLRTGDLVARYGGDEFALILADASERRAQPVIDRVRAAISSLDVPGGKVTACVGVAQHVADEPPLELVRRADDALREAKMALQPGSTRRAGRPAPAPAEAATRGLRPAAWRRHKWRAVAGDIGLGIARCGNLEDATAFCVAELHEVLDLTACTVLRLSGGELAPVAVVGTDDDAGDAQSQMAAERALHEKRPMLGGRRAGRRDSDIENADAGRARRGAEIAGPLIVNGRPWGAICCLAPPDGLDGVDAELAMAVGEHLSSAIRTFDLYEQLTESMVGTAEALAAALEAKDSYTADHARSIAKLAVAVGEQMALPEALIEDLRYAGIFHDVGKIAVPDALINKPGPLDDEEWELVKQHPVAGAEILAPVPFLYGVRTIVRHAHEHWDGSGYPDGLAGAQIPLGARIVLAADAYHAMTSDRPYRAGLSEAEARAELRAGSGTQFDPEVVEALLSVLERRDASADG